MSHQLVTVKGYDFFEVSSAMQKEIRRGNQENALYWAIELHESNYAKYAWKRLMIMAIEDIGVASSNIAVHINSLHDIAMKLENKNDKKHQDRLPFVQAVVLLCGAPKSRYVDWLLNVKFDEHYHADNMKPIPDYALDIHTRRGKMQGKTIEDFFTEGSLLEKHKLQGNEQELKDTCQKRWKDPKFDAQYPKKDTWMKWNGGGFGKPVQKDIFGH